MLKYIIYNYISIEINISTLEHFTQCEMMVSIILAVYITKMSNIWWDIGIPSVNMVNSCSVGLSSSYNSDSVYVILI